ncbi:proclotting enzyme-like [Aricia agestis]|uniref:proclotting enzyme-like n=1 Tax=Aricia agestis TaxID=91739 RepID=UPI001C20467C|nr:proclotting enzyme-like [Aricia agestis]
MADIQLWQRSLDFLIYVLVLSVGVDGQRSAHPVSFVDPGGYRNPYIQSRHPEWGQFPLPRKRSDGPTYYNRAYEPYPYNEEARHPGLLRFQGYQDYNDRPPVRVIQTDSDQNDGRLFSDSAFTRISETLGAINTVGHYLVDIVKENERNVSDPNLQKLPGAIYTLTKNVLGTNVTDTIAPIVKKALPKVLPDAPITKIATGDVDSKECTTPDGEQGYCEDLSNCPQLLLNLVGLRESLCFKELFVPGVCCPRDAVIATPAIEKPAVSTTSKPTFLVPVTTPATVQLTTKKPSGIISLTTKKPKVTKATTTTRKPTTRTTPRTTTTTVTTTTTTTTHAVPQFIGNYSNIVDIEDCGQREDEGGRIVGGTESKPGAWPWMAAIYLHGSKRREFWCGGTLIDKRHVLTAAHCTRDSKQRPFPARQFSVRLGDVDLARDDEPSRPVTLRVAAVRAHDQFSRVGYYNDIAVLVLAENVQKSKYVIPICLPRGDLARRTFDGATATVVGWGTTRYGGSESSRQLEARLPVWRNEDCDRAYFQPITETFMCAGYPRGGVDACQGDSGGPLMLLAAGRWTQIGVVSFGNKCGEPGYPGVYTRVTHYLNWLTHNVT